MKVLWFANNPCAAVEKLRGEHVTSGGWLYSLASIISEEKDIELHIAFYWKELLESFEYKNIFYHPISRIDGKSKLARLISRQKRIHGINVDCNEVRMLDRVIKDVTPDIIHVHGTEENFGLLYRFNPKCPIVISIQGLISSLLCKFYSGISKNAITQKESILKKIAGLDINSFERLNRVKAKNEIESLKNIPNIIGRTFWDKACTLAINPNRRYFKVGEIIRQEFYKNRWNKQSFSTPLRIVTTVSGGIFKGLESIYSTAAVLKDSNIKFEWVVIGIKNDDFLSKVVERDVHMSAESLSINMRGRMYAEDMIKIMLDSDIFVQVSHIENSPNSLCEAMILGMPVIATYAGGTASLLNNGKEGILIQDGDPYVMAGVIIEYSKNFNKAKEMGCRAAEVARERHNPNTVVGELINVYKDILNIK